MKAQIFMFHYFLFYTHPCISKIKYLFTILISCFSILIYVIFFVSPFYFALLLDLIQKV